MNNNDLAEAIATDAALTKADARKLIDAVFEGWVQRVEATQA